MTAAPPEGQLIEGRRSLEVRWILPGPLDTAVAGWCARFPAEVTTRDDAYLLAPELRGCRVKVRAGPALEAKVYRGSPGILEAPGRARGRIQSWQKCFFPFSPTGEQGGEPPGWTVIRRGTRSAGSSWPAGGPRPSPGRLSSRDGYAGCVSHLAKVMTQTGSSRMLARAVNTAAGRREPGGITNL